ncbi:hypothetical protein OsJ_32713 [Oryza sativa Japonica Group]|uniref:Uncharacterized protein n=1 Tax=Oryza sativa subsp. japonica TaxID=39947 RepID=A3C7Z2_ORYSJ|nr:hypothetical protein OsJ_32713 [Oryza sativa Japonica Group]
MCVAARHLGGDIFVSRASRQTSTTSPSPARPRTAEAPPPPLELEEVVWEAGRATASRVILLVVDVAYHVEVLDGEEHLGCVEVGGGEREAAGWHAVDERVEVAAGAKLHDDTGEVSRGVEVGEEGGGRRGGRAAARSASLPPHALASASSPPPTGPPPSSRTGTALPHCRGCR